MEVKQWNAGVTPNTPYNDLLDQYRTRKITSSHPIMSKHYVENIAAILRDAHQLIDPSFITLINNNYPDWDWNKYYEYNAFQGLDGTPEYETHRNNPNYVNEANSYVGRSSTAWINSTKVPICDN